MNKVIAAAVLFLSACAHNPAQTMQAGGADIAYELHHNGRPTLVFEAGLGDGHASWAPLIEELDGEVSVFAYSRPGYTRRRFADTHFDSDMDGSRTGPEIARHLRDILAAAGVEPPYILIGHSIGGLYSLSYAHLFPDEVVGVVLVDSRPPAFTQRCIEQRAGMCVPPAALQLAMPGHMRAEIRGHDETVALVSDPSDLGDIPMSVIVAGNRDHGASRQFQELWIREQARFAQQARNARFVMAEGARHYVHHDRTALVANEIRRFIGLSQQPVE